MMQSYQALLEQMSGQKRRTIDGLLKKIIQFHLFPRLHSAEMYGLLASG